MKRILYIPFDHLNRNHGVLKTAQPSDDIIVLVESARMVSGDRWHPERIFFMISAARHFAESLRSEGFLVEYIKAPTTTDGLDEVKALHPQLEIFACEPSSFRQYRALQDHGVLFLENDFFLTPRSLFADWASQQKNFLMENFYRKQRQRLGVLMEASAPIGGQWNFDKSNRLPPPKEYKGPAYLEFERDEIDRRVSEEIGHSPSNTWATTREGALQAMENFITYHFHAFGPLEDAMTTQNWALHHSLISPYLNVGLLHPLEVLDAAEAAFKTGKIPIESAEGFVRQIIGWREYINGMYWFLGDDYKYRNHLEARLPLLPLFTNPQATSMNCLKVTVSDVEKRAWVHHIPRLMILSNIATLAGVNPQLFLDWMRERFIDAAEWVMVPNVIGMGAHADGGLMMSKPYISGGSYISKMSNYCKGCAYNPKLRTGETACPFTTLYWDFLARHSEVFSRNHRMFQQYAGLKKISDFEEVHERATQVISGLLEGKI